MLRAEGSAGWPTADGGSQERLTHNVTGRSRNARTISGADHVETNEVISNAASDSDAVSRTFPGMHQDSVAGVSDAYQFYQGGHLGNIVNAGGGEGLRSASAGGEAARQASTCSRASAYGPHAVQDEADWQCGLSRQRSGTCTACGPLTPRPRPAAAPCEAHRRAKRRRTARGDWQREQVEVALDFLAAAMPLDGGGGTAFAQQAVAPYKQPAPAPALYSVPGCRAPSDTSAVPCDETTAESSCAQAVSTMRRLPPQASLLAPFQEQCPLPGGAALGRFETQRATAPFAAWALKEAAGRAAAAGTAATASAAKHSDAAEEETGECAANVECASGASAGPSSGVAAELSADAGTPAFSSAGNSCRTEAAGFHSTDPACPPSRLGLRRRWGSPLRGVSPARRLAAPLQWRQRPLPQQQVAPLADGRAPSQPTVIHGGVTADSARRRQSARQPPPSTRQLCRKLPTCRGRTA